MLKEAIGGITEPSEFGRIDTEDAVLGPLFVGSSGAASGILSVSALNFALTDPAFSGVSYAFILSAGVLLAAFLTNQTSFSQMEDEYTALTGFGIAAIVGLEFSPVIESAITGSTIAGIAYLFLVSAMYYTVTYLG